MEFNSRNAQQQGAPAGAPMQRPAHPSGKKQRGKVMRIVSAVLLVSVGLLVASLTVYVATGGSKNEADYLNKDKFQAVFLNGGQVYFGKVRDLNDKFITLDNIYYLRVNEQAQGAANTNQTQSAQQDISLAKLGCELHGPEDEMVINRTQVTFWENLKDDGQVTKAIAEFVKQNPEGQKCNTAAAS
jgi:hypothetical protein